MFERKSGDRHETDLVSRKSQLKPTALARIVTKAIIQKQFFLGALWSRWVFDPDLPPAPTGVHSEMSFFASQRIAILLRICDIILKYSKRINHFLIVVKEFIITLGPSRICHHHTVRNDYKNIKIVTKSNIAMIH